MASAIFFAITIVILAGLYLGARVMLGAYLQRRGTRLVACPETGGPTAVTLDALLAARATPGGAPQLRLQACTRWPERRDCGQECLQQIETRPDGCLVRTIVAEWFAGRSCALCHRPFRGIESWSHRSGFLDADGRAVEWVDVRLETLPDLLATCAALCWNCTIAESFRRHRPEPATNWPAPQGGPEPARPSLAVVSAATPPQADAQRTRPIGRDGGSDGATRIIMKGETT